MAEVCLGVLVGSNPLSFGHATDGVVKSSSILLRIGSRKVHSPNCSEPSCGVECLLTINMVSSPIFHHTTRFLALSLLAVSLSFCSESLAGPILSVSNLSTAQLIIRSRFLGYAIHMPPPFHRAQ